MNDLLYLFNLICARRGVQLRNVENFAFNVRVTFGLAAGTFLLPAVADTFYYLVGVNQLTGLDAEGQPVFVIAPNSGQGSAGTIGFNFLPSNASFECDSFQYTVNDFTAGSVYLLGSGFKITTS